MNTRILSAAALAFVLLMASCSKSTETKTAETTEVTASAPEIIKADKAEFFGDSISQEGAQPVADVLPVLAKGDTAENLKVYGEIVKSCQNKGCWMEVRLPDDKTMRVMFKDYGFFMPVADLAGRKVVIEGKGWMDTTGVADLKHFAEDANKSKEEIEKITEPKVVPSFEARGVIMEGMPVAQPSANATQPTDAPAAH